MPMSSTMAAPGGIGGVREETFSDISLAPTTMTSTFVGDTSFPQAQSLNPLEDLDAFDSQGGGQGVAGGHGGDGGGTLGGGNTATEMLINQASSITTNLQQALPAVASTVFSHFSNYLKGGQPHSHGRPQEQSYPHQMGGFGEGPAVVQPSYASPLDDIYHQQMSNPTESVNQMPLFISPQDQPATTTPVSSMPPTGAAAQNTYRIGGQKKKTYAPPPIQGFSAQGPVNLTPGYDPTMPIQSSTPAMPPMPGQEPFLQAASPAMRNSPSPLQQRPPSIPPPMENLPFQPQQPPTVLQSNMMSGPAAPPTMFMPPPEPTPPPPQMNFFQAPNYPPTAPQPNVVNPEPEKSKFSISSFFTAGIDILQGKPTQPSNDPPQLYGQSGFGDFGGIGVGQEQQSQFPPPTIPQQQPVSINPQLFNTNPLQAPIPTAAAATMPSIEGNSNSAMGLFNPMQPFPAQAAGIPPLPSGILPPAMIPTSDANLPPPMTMQEPPKAQGNSSGYRMTRSRPAYANPHLIAQSSATSGFVVGDQSSSGQIPTPTHWFNPTSVAAAAPTTTMTPVPDVTQQSAVMEPLNLIAAPPTFSAMVGATPIVSEPNKVAEIPVAPVSTLFTPTITPQAEGVTTPDLVVPKATDIQQQQPGLSSSFFTPIVDSAQQSFMPPSPAVITPTVDQPAIFTPSIPQPAENPVRPSSTNQEPSRTPDLFVPQQINAPPPHVQSFFTPPTATNPVVDLQQPQQPISGFAPTSSIPVQAAPAVPSSLFFDSRFSAPSATTSHQSGNDMFQPVNFFNAFNAPTSIPEPAPAQIQPPAVLTPTLPISTETTHQLDGNANVTTSAIVNPNGQQTLDGGQSDDVVLPPPPPSTSLWSDNNANIVTQAIEDASLPVPPAAATLDQSQADDDDDFLSSFEKVDDINANFFDSPPDVKPTDPIANPNFFKSFMKAKFTAEKLGDEFNDQSLVVEPPSQDDSSISCASFPSFDQSSVLMGGQVTEAGFQTHPPTFDDLSEAMSRVSMSPSMRMVSEMDGMPTMTRSRSGSMSSQVSTSNRSASAAVTGPYRPIYKHWFYSQKEANGKTKWAPFTMTDSLALETAFMDPSYDPDKLISTDGGRHDVDIRARRRRAVYWSAEENEVRRCSWFFKTIDCRFLPFEEDVAELLEQEYKEAYESKQWQRKVTLPNGEVVNFHDANVMVHYIASTESSWGNSSSQATMKRVVKRGVDEFNIEDGEPAKIDHVLFMVHGIGAACDLKFRSVEEVVDEFRSIAHQMVQSHYRSSYDSGEIGRIEVLPISWHSELHSEESGIDAKLKAITLESIPKIRSLANETILDVLFYTSPKFCQHIIEIVSGALNRLYTLFCQRNPAFTGGISLAGHSLGSLILFDLLSHQKAEPENRENLAATTGQMGSVMGEQHGEEPTNYMMGHAGTGQPFISYPQLLFTVKNFFALGSPIGMFVTVRGIDTLGLDFKLPSCDRFFNIFHPYDPVAYRIEGLINVECCSLQPVLIPHHKGRKRMHLELRETMERVKGDLKARIINTFKSTLETVTQFKGFARTEANSIASEVDKVLDEQLQMNGNGSTTAGTTELASPATPNVSTATNSDVDPGETDLSLGRLNQGRRIDYVLQEAPLEFFNGYLFALTSHVCYWESEDTTLFVVKEIYSSMGVRTDSKIPQHSLTIERPTI